MDSVSMKKVYCPCGCIVDLDKSYFERRLILGKDLECVHCRNSRISREIDELNAHFRALHKKLAAEQGAFAAFALAVIAG